MRTRVHIFGGIRRGERESSIQRVQSVESSGYSRLAVSQRRHCDLIKILPHCAQISFTHSSARASSFGPPLGVRAISDLPHPPHLGFGDIVGGEKRCWRAISVSVGTTERPTILAATVGEGESRLGTQALNFRAWLCCGLGCGNVIGPYSVNRTVFDSSKPAVILADTARIRVRLKMLSKTRKYSERVQTSLVAVRVQIVNIVHRRLRHARRVSVPRTIADPLLNDQAKSPNNKGKETGDALFVCCSLRSSGATRRRGIRDMSELTTRKDPIRLQQNENAIYQTEGLATAGEAEEGFTIASPAFLFRGGRATV